MNLHLPKLKNSNTNRHFYRVVVIVIVLMLGAFWRLPIAHLAFCDTEAPISRIVTAWDGSPPDETVNIADMSPDGRFLILSARATNLIPNDTNGKWDAFFYDRLTCQISRVSVSSAGTEGNDDSYGASISDDGRYTTIYSYASNLVSDDTSLVYDIFRHDLQTGETIRVSLSDDEREANGPAGAGMQSISADGRYVVFSAYGVNFAPGDNNNQFDVFVRDVQLGQTILASVASDGTQANNSSSYPETYLGNPIISGNGQFVAFVSEATNLVANDNNPFCAGNNTDVPGTVNCPDVFRHNLQTGETELVSVTAGGIQTNRNTRLGGISDDGRFIVFQTAAANLVANDTNGTIDVFVKDMQTGIVTRESVASSGQEGNYYSAYASISPDGRYVGFASMANNLVSGDTNNTFDGFIHDRQTGETERLPLNGRQPNAISSAGVLSNNAEYYTLSSYATNIVADDGPLTGSYVGKKSFTVPPIDLVVNTTDDEADGVCDAVHCSLRDALTDANIALDTNTISFNISGSGLHTIQVQLPLPNSLSPVVIDGTSQPGYASGAPVIELDGTNAGSSANGLTIMGGNSTVKGLVVNRFSQTGILLSGGGSNVITANFVGTDRTGTQARPNGDGISVSQSPNNVIGGTLAIDRNVISGNTNNGLLLTWKATTGTVVAGNYIGTDVNGTTALGNGQSGIRIAGARNNQIGGTSAEARNVISGNQFGVRITREILITTPAAATGNIIQGNYIGTDVNGTTALGNQSVGIELRATSNLLGGTQVGAGNLISGNVVGIGILGNANTIQGNYIGTDAAGTQAIGNTAWGIEIVGDVIQTFNNNMIGGTSPSAGNIIAFNGSAGIAFHMPYSITGNAVLSNSIFSNGSLGIDLSVSNIAADDGVTTNDPSDADTGPNNLQNYPQLLHAESGAAVTSIQGTLSSSANRSFRLEFFANPTCDATGFGEGKTYLGFTNVTTNGSGAVTFSVNLAATVSVGQFVTATATDFGNNTSEFSACVVIAPPTPQTGPIFTVNTAADVNDNVCGIGDCSLREAIIAANSNANTNTIIFNIAPAGEATIQPQSELPALIYPVIIDGTTQPGFAGLPLIELDGTNAGSSARGLTLAGGSSTIKGLIINRFALSGIWLAVGGDYTVIGNYLGTDSTGTQPRGNRDGITTTGSANNRIGGLSLAERNIISGNTDDGINLYDSTTTGTVIEGNYIGVDVTGEATLGNGESGIELSNISIATIGGVTPAARNIISGNQYGIYFSDGGTSVLIEGNYIGTNAAGTVAIPNNSGIWLFNGSNNRIGGPTTGAGNIISGNVTGIKLSGTNNRIEGNYIGIRPDGVSPLGNTGAGIEVETSAFAASPGNTIGGTTPGTGNIIAYNGLSAVTSNSSGLKPFAVLGNTIFANGGLSIDLGGDGITLNDPGDFDTGANNLQNFPQLTSSGLYQGQLTIAGMLNSAANKTYRLEFFANADCDVSGYGEGQVYLSFASITTNGNGDAAFTANLPATASIGQFITATATDPNNNTSEFSACIPVIVLSPPSAAPIENYYNTPDVTLSWNGATWAVGYIFQWDDNADFTSPTEILLSASAQSVTITLPGNGIYYWRVRGKNAANTMTNWSPIQSFQVHE